MPSATFVAPNPSTPQTLTNIGSYTVRWTQSGTFARFSTTKLQMIVGGGWTDVSTPFTSPSSTTTFSWATEAGGSTVIGRDEIATDSGVGGFYSLRLLYSPTVGSPSSIGTTTFNFQRSFTVTRSEAAIDVNDAVTFIAPFIFSYSTSDEVSVVEAVASGKGRRRQAFDATTIQSFMFPEHHRPIHTKTLPTNYLIIKDTVSKKFISNSHSGDDAFPMSDMTDYMLCEDYVLYEMRGTATLGRTASDQLFISDNVRFMFIPDLKEVVYHIDHDVFSHFTPMEIKGVNILSGGGEQSNINLILTNSNKILKFPGDNVTEKDALIQTKTIYLEKGVAQNMRIGYEGTLDYIDVESLPLEQEDSHVRSTSMNNIPSRKWRGIPGSVGRIRAVMFKIFNATKIKNFILKYKQRI